MRAAWWWVDRWRASSAYSSMTLEEQGAYRNLLDELWLRGGTIPSDPAALARISGAGRRFATIWARICHRFYEVPGGYRNTTHDQVEKESNRLAAKQKRYREAKKRRHDTGVTLPVTFPVTPGVTKTVTLPGLCLQQKETEGAGSASGLPGGPSGSPAPDQAKPHWILDAERKEAAEKARAYAAAKRVIESGESTRPGTW